jgi:hypothetical protein
MSEDEWLSATGYRSRIEATGISQIREHVEKEGMRKRSASKEEGLTLSAVEKWIDGEWLSERGGREVRKRR